MKQKRSKKDFLNDKNHNQQKKKAKIIAKLVLEVKVNAGIRLLNDDTSSRVLPLSADVIKKLRQNHPIQNHQMIL